MENEKKLAFQDGILSEPLVSQLERLSFLSAYAREKWEDAQAFVTEGILPDELSFDVNVNALEAQVFSLGLNLVGFFLPEMADVAEAISERMRYLSDEQEPSEELKTRIEAASGKIVAARTANMLGFESTEAMEAAFENEGGLFAFGGDEVPSDEDLGIIARVPVVE